ncbi:MAG: class I SAM-dependent methyltransferase [Anaerolineae bacterium]
MRVGWRAKTASFHSAFRAIYRWAAERLYHEAAWAYDLVAWFVSWGQWDDWRRQVLDHAVGERILEIGFGTGHLLTEATSQGFEVWGIDPSWEMQRVSGRRMGDARRYVRRAMARAQALPFVDQTFDTVIATFPTPYIVEPATFREVVRVLRHSGPGDGGRFVVTGLGFRTEHSVIRWLLRWVFGGAKTIDGTEVYRRMAESQGFAVTVVDDHRQTTRVPVFVLQPRHGCSRLKDP